MVKMAPLPQAFLSNLPISLASSHLILFFPCRLSLYIRLSCFVPLFFGAQYCYFLLYIARTESNLGNIYNRKINKMILPGIQLYRILQHYNDEKVLRETKPKQLKAQFQDFLTLMDFAGTRLPAKIKGMKNYIKQYDSLLERTKRQAQTQIPPMNQLNLKLAHQMYAKSIIQTQEEQYDDFVEPTKPELEIKLKFFQAEGLPPDAHWNTIYQENLKCLYIENQKHRIVVDLAFNLQSEDEDKQYFWQPRKLEFKKGGNISDQSQYILSYFQENLKKKDEEKYEITLLGYLYRLLHFIDFIEYQYILQKSLHIPITSLFEQKIILKYHKNSYKFFFSDALETTIPQLMVSAQEYPLSVRFKKDKEIECFIEMKQFCFKCGEMKIIPQPQILMELLERMKLHFDSYLYFYNKFTNFMKAFMRSTIFYWGGYVWRWVENAQQQLEHFMNEGILSQKLKEGFYVCEGFSKYDFQIRIKERKKMDLSPFPQSFLLRLIQITNQNYEIIFTHLRLIKLLIDQNNSDSELIEYHIEGNQIVHRFSRKFYYEQRIRTDNKDRQQNDIQFNNFLLQSKISISFTELKISCNRHRQMLVPVMDIYLNKKWLEYLQHREREKLQSEPLELEKVFMCIQDQKEHFLMRRIYDKKLSDANKSLFKLDLNDE